MLEPIGHDRLREKPLCNVIKSMNKFVYLYPNIPKDVAMNHKYIITNTHRENTVGLNCIQDRTLHHTESTSCNISVNRYFFDPIN